MKQTLTSGRLAACALAIGAGSCSSAPTSTAPPAAEEPHAEAARAEAPPITPSEASAPGDTAPAVARAEIKTLEFKTEIAAPVEKVWDTMLSPDGYRKWTSAFMAGSYFEGSWSEGERMHFLAPGGSGMVAVIAENRPHELVSIEHLGFVMAGKEDTTSDAVRSWAPAYENYHFASTPGGTEVTIVHEVLVPYEGYMNATWPRALASLKSLCETE